MTQDTIPPSARKRTPRWVKLLLGASLALNLLIFGVIGGAVVGGKKDGRSYERGPSSGFMAITRALPREDRRAIGQQLREKGPAREPRGASVDQWISLLEAPEFDLQAAQAMADAQTLRGQERRATGARLTLEHIAKMPIEKRRDIAAKLRKRQR